MDESNRRRIVILGKTGVGKSSLANTIFGEELFKIGHTACSETSKCRAETKPVNRRNITLIDTPGLFDTDRSEELKPEIMKCITKCSPGLHAFLILFKVEKFTEQEQAVITKINQYFSEEVFKYATVLFTHGDQLKEGQTIEDFVRDNELLGDLVKKCGGRCHVIDNKNWKNNLQDEYRSNQFQVKELLKTIEKMIEANEGSCYTNEMLQAVEERIRQQEERISQSSGDMPEEEIRENAEEREYNWLLSNFADIRICVLLGALFGVAVLVKVGPSVVKAGLTLYKSLASAKGAAAAAAAAAAVAAAAAAAVGVRVRVTAAVGEGVAAVETATAAAAAGTSLIAVTATCPVVGSVGGGLAGYYTAEEAKTALEAIERAARLLMNGGIISIADYIKLCFSE